MIFITTHVYFRAVRMIEIAITFICIHEDLLQGALPRYLAKSSSEQLYEIILVLKISGDIEVMSYLVLLLVF